MRGYALLFFVGIFALINASTADAFYWRDWPGSGVSTTSSSSSSSTTTQSATTQSAAVTSDPVVVIQGSDSGPSDPGTTATTPEPSTLIGGLIGLGFLAIWRIRKRGNIAVAL